MSSLLEPVVNAIDEGLNFVQIVVALAALAGVGPWVGMLVYRRTERERSFVVGAWMGAIVAALPLALLLAGSSAVVTLGAATVYGVGSGVVAALLAPLIREELKRQGVRPPRR